MSCHCNTHKPRRYGRDTWIALALALLSCIIVYALCTKAAPIRPRRRVVYDASSVQMGAGVYDIFGVLTAAVAVAK